MNQTRIKLSETMGKINPDIKKMTLNENVGGNLQGGVNFSQISEEDQALFKSIFEDPSIRGAYMSGVEGNYVPVNWVRYWEDADKLKVQELVDQFNSQSTGHNMVLNGFEDYEVEYDHDRAWNASFMFAFLSK